MDYQNAQGEMANSDMIAKNMVSAQYDLILGIATPAAMSAYSAAKDTDIPLYSLLFLTPGCRDCKDPGKLSTHRHL